MQTKERDIFSYHWHLCKDKGENCLPEKRIGQYFQEGKVYATKENILYLSGLETKKGPCYFKNLGSR